MALLDFGGSVLVLLLWSNASVAEGRLISERLREMRYSLAIGSMMLFLGFFLVADSLKTLLSRESAHDSRMGIIASFFGFLSGTGLASYKYIVGKALDSPVVVADAVSSMCTGLSSCLALLVVVVDDKLWWSDATAGFTSAFYTLYSGASTILGANAEISRLNRLQKGGPRAAPEYVRRLLKSDNGSYYQTTEGVLSEPAVEVKLVSKSQDEEQFRLVASSSSSASSASSSTSASASAYLPLRSRSVEAEVEPPPPAPMFGFLFVNFNFFTASKNDLHQNSSPFSSSHSNSSGGGGYYSSESRLLAPESDVDDEVVVRV